MDRSTATASPSCALSRFGAAPFHPRSGKSINVHTPVMFLAREREIAEEAYPGDIVGIPNHGQLRIGDALTEGEALRFVGIPSFAPELLQKVRADDPLKAKHLGKALTHLAEEGARRCSRRGGRRVDQASPGRRFGRAGRPSAPSTTCRSLPGHHAPRALGRADDERELKPSGPPGASPTTGPAPASRSSPTVSRSPRRLAEDPLPQDPASTRSSAPGLPPPLSAPRRAPRWALGGARPARERRIERTAPGGEGGVDGAQARSASCARAVAQGVERARAPAGRSAGSCRPACQ
jgi:hypothetical protein